MPNVQKAFVVRVRSDGTDNLAALNAELEQGWRVIQITPMGGTGQDRQGQTHLPLLAALVILERQEPDEPSPLALEEVKEAPEEAVEDPVEGDGADPELPNPPNP